jgi:tRNA pseudouridine38-40 synthase
MVRIITGTLIGVSEGKFNPSDMPDIIKSLDRTKAGVTAQPEGLYLNRVFY